MPSLEIRPLTVAELPAAMELIADSLSESPIVAAVFRGKPRNRRLSLLKFIRPILPIMQPKQEYLGAFEDDRLVGILVATRPNQPDITFRETLHLLPGVLFGHAFGTPMRIILWLGQWNERNPSGTHWHIGPIAVARDSQGRGVGTALMTTLCAKLDEPARREKAYLEADEKQTAMYFQRFGFRQIGRGEILNVNNWYMERLPRIG